MFDWVLSTNHLNLSSSSRTFPNNILPYEYAVDSKYSVPRLSKKLLILSTSRGLEYIITLFSILLPILICTLMVLLRRFYGPPFQSINNNIWAEGWINACRNAAVLDNPDPGNPATIDQAFNFTGTGIDKKATCSTFVPCILYQATGDYPSYWASAASILAFIPTIVGLLSNSIEEAVAIADESPALAILLALSSTASFSSRFTNFEVPRIFEQHPDYTLSAQKLMVDLVARSLHSNEKGRTRRWLDNKTFHIVGATIALFGCAGGGLVFGLDSPPLRMFGMGMSGQVPRSIMGNPESESSCSKHSFAGISLPY
jgi:hypothetical protein